MDQSDAVREFFKKLSAVNERESLPLEWLHLRNVAQLAQINGLQKISLHDSNEVVETGHLKDFGVGLPPLANV